MMMDADILRTIIKSCNDIGNVTQSENKCANYVSGETLLLQSDTMLNSLCMSLSNLLSYKVSKEAYQRYSVRLLIIDILRKLCRVTNNFEHLPIFTSKENSLKFVSTLLDKHLTDDVLNECYSDDTLISLTIAIMHLSVDNVFFVPYVDRLFVRLSQLEVNDKIERLLCNALCSNVHLQLSTKETIYVSQKFKLIEEPLLNSLMCMFPDLKKENCVDSQSKEKLLNQLLKFSTESACIFQLMFNFLKELLVQLQYAPTVLDFIDLIFKRVSACCENQNRNILHLYPRKLHSFVILLKIKPEHHTVQTREYTLQIMKQIFNKNKNTLLILLSHSSEWLEYFANYITNER